MEDDSDFGLAIAQARLNLQAARARMLDVRVTMEKSSLAIARSNELIEKVSHVTERLILPRGNSTPVFIGAGNSASDSISPTWSGKASRLKELLHDLLQKTAASDYSI